MPYLDHTGFREAVYGWDSITEIYISDVDDFVLPEKGAVYNWNGYNYAAENAVIRIVGDTKTKRELTLTFKGSNGASDGGGGTKDGKPWNAIAQVSIDYETVPYATRRDADGNNIVNSAGQFPEVPPEREVVVPVYNISRARQMSIAESAGVGNSINGKVNEASFSALGLTFGAGEALFSYSSNAKYWGPTKDVYVEETIKIRTNPLTWITPIIDEGLAFKKDGKLSRMLLREPDTGKYIGYNVVGGVATWIAGDIKIRTTPFKLNGRGRPLTGEDDAAAYPASMPRVDQEYDPGINPHPRLLPTLSNNEAVYLGYWMIKKAASSVITALDLDYNVPL